MTYGYKMGKSTTRRRRMACTIAAQKLRLPVAHVDGGIRPDDWRMPEEINRLASP